MGVQLVAPAKAESKLKPVASNDRPVRNALKPNELLVYDTLCNSRIPLKAYDLLDELQERGLRAPMTIYRALESLTAKGLVKKIASLNAFTAVKRNSNKTASAFLICRHCGSATEVRLVEEQIAQLFSPFTINLDDVFIEATGECHQICKLNSTKPG